MGDSPQASRRPTSRARALATLGFVAVGVPCLGALAERAWFSRELPLHTAPPAGTSVPRSDLPTALLLVIVDGLSEAAARSMPELSMHSRFGASGIAITGEPTMSSACVRAIVAGRPPDHYTAFRNDHPVPIRGTVLDALAERGLRVAHAGDPLLPRMVPSAYRAGDVFTPSRERLERVTDLDDRTFPVALAKAADEAVDVLTVHLVSADLVGHKRGARSPQYAEACDVLDRRVAEIVLAFRSAHTHAHVLVAADHGLSPRGTHGAGEVGARRAPFVLSGYRVPPRTGLEIPQTALASTLAAALDLPALPFAEAPPLLGLLRLSPQARIRALDGFAAARSVALGRAGRSSDARALDDARQRARRTTGRAAESDLLAAVSRSTPRPPSSSRGLALAAALALATIGAALAGRSLATAATTAALVGAMLAVAGGALAFQQTLLENPGAAWPLRGAAVVVATIGFGVLLVRRVRRVGRDVAAGPWPPSVRVPAVGPDAVELAIAAGIVVVLVRSMRLAVDDVIHLPALVGGAAVAAAWVGARRGAPASRRVAFPLGVAIFVGLTRALEMTIRETWIADAAPAASIVAQVALFAGAAAIAVEGSRVRASSPGRVAALLLVLHAAAFHALGGGEWLTRIDPSNAFVPGAAGLDAPVSFAAGVAPLALRAGLLWLVLLAAARRALSRGSDAPGGADDRFPALAASLAAGLGAGACVLVAAAFAWADWSWWTQVAHPVFVLTIADAAGLLLAAGVLVVLGDRRRARSLQEAFAAQR